MSETEGWLRIRIETGPEFRASPAVAEKLERLAGALNELAEAAEDDVGGFAFGAPTARFHGSSGDGEKVYDLANAFREVAPKGCLIGTNYVQYQFAS